MQVITECEVLESIQGGSTQPQDPKPLSPVPNPPFKLQDQPPHRMVLW
jgi:hypothetical protein